MPIRTTAMIAGAVALGVATPALAGDIVWARDGDIDSLDPHRATSTLSRQVWYQIYDSLLEFDDSGKPVPNLAKSWTVSEDGTEVVFTLNDGITCHDGTPFNADDVMWTVDRALGEENPDLLGPITDAPVYLKVEAAYAAAAEGALHLEDILARRMRISIEYPHRGVDCARAVAEVVAPIRGWSAADVAHEVAVS